MSITLKDIAEAAGVSRQVVTTVMTGRGTARASTETTARIQRMAHEMGYRPHGPARSLATGKTHTIELQAHSLGDATHHLPAHHLPLWAGFAWFCQKRRYNLILTSGEEIQGEGMLRNLRGHNIDGLIVIGASSLQVMEAARTFKAPVICVNPEMAAEEISKAGFGVVNFDNAGGVRLAIQYLYAQGHRKIGFIRGISKNSDFTERWQAYGDLMAEYGLPVRPEWIWEAAPLPKGGELVGQQILNTGGRDLPTAILTANDNLALGLLRVLQSSGLSVPQDISIVGFDDIEAAALVSPGLTTVRLDWFGLAHAGAAQLFEALAQGTPEPYAGKLLRYPLTFIERGSCRALPV